MKLPLFAVCRKSQIGFLVKSRANIKGTKHKDKKQWLRQCLSFKVMYAPSSVPCIQSLNENFFTVTASGHRFNTTQEECKGVKCKVIPILLSWSSLVSTQTTILVVILFIDTARQQVNSCHSMSEPNRSTDKTVMLFRRLHEMKINIHRVKQNWMHLVETPSDVAHWATAIHITVSHGVPTFLTFEQPVTRVWFFTGCVRRERRIGLKYEGEAGLPWALVHGYASFSHLIMFRCCLKC